MATATTAAVRAALAAARVHNLSVLLSPHVDLNWALPALAPVKAGYAAGAVSRHDIGAAFSDIDWATFFVAYTAHVMSWAAEAVAAAAPGAATECRLGARGGVSAVVLGDGLDHVFAQEARMRDLIAAVRGSGWHGCLTLVADGKVLPAVAFWDALDVIGHEAYWPLSDAPQPLGSPLPVGDMTAGWADAVSMLAAASAAAGGKPVVLLAAGAQSRPNCHLAPWGTGAPAAQPGTRAPDGNNQGDPSAWPCSYDPGCQANLYRSLIDAFSPQPWWAGVTFYRWSADPGAGGPSDTDWTPHGKAAEAVVRAWTAALAGDDGDGAGAVAAALRASAAAALAAPPATAAAAHRRAYGAATAPSSNSSFTAPAPAPSSGFSGVRGFVFGGPDEWSSPNYRLDSPGAVVSLDNMRSLGATSVEVVIQWYVADANSTGMYPITDPTSPMPTTTDDELRTFAAAARARVVSIALSPMLDPDWTLPAQLGCRTGWPEPPGCHWRGEIGGAWPKVAGDCAAQPAWAAWHTNYAAFVLHYAALAAELGLEYLVIAHELQTPTQNCGAQWAALLARVRAAFPGGKVLAAMEGDAMTAGPAQLAWMRDLDLMGYECYLGSNAPKPASGAPWEDALLQRMLEGVAAQMPPLANFSAALGGLRIACTEVGWMAAPWAGESGWGTMFDLTDSSVPALNVDGAAHALAYEAFIRTLEAQPWYAGVWFWLWRADPTAGGASDNSPVPWAKASGTAIAELWGGAAV